MRVPRISIIIPTCNDAAELKTTVLNIFANSHSEPEIIVIDDTATDGSVDAFVEYAKTKMRNEYKKNLRIIRNKTRQGVDVSRNLGVDKASGELIAFTDAHTRWPNGGAEQMAQAALDTGGIICASFQNWSNQSSPETAGSITYGAEFSNRKGRALGNAYIKNRPDDNINPINAIIGSCYMMPKTLFYELGGWYEVPTALWGYSEQALAWKVYFWQMGSMYNIRDVVIKHKIKEKHFPYSINQQNIAVQAYFVHYVCFEEKTFNELWLPNLTSFFGPPPHGFLESPFVQQQRKEFQEKKVKSDEDFFNELLPNKEAR